MKRCLPCSLGIFVFLMHASLFASEKIVQNLKDARLALSQGQAQAALVEIQSVLAESPENAEAKVLLAKAKLLLHEPREAISILQRLRVEGRPWQEWMILLGIAYLEINTPQKVLDEVWIMDKAYASESLREQVALLRAQAAMRLNKYEEAMSWYQEVLTKNKESQEALLGLSKIALNKNAYEKAEALALKALEKSTKKSEILAYLGEINLKSNHADAAKRYFNEALALNQKLLSARLGLAQLEFESDQYESFSALMTPLVKEVNLPIKAEYYLGMEHLLHNRFDRAEAHFKRLLQENPNETLLMLLAKINIKKALWNEAKHHLKQVLLKNASQKEANNLLAFVLIKQKEYDEALKVLPPDNKVLRALIAFEKKNFSVFKAQTESLNSGLTTNHPLVLATFIESEKVPHYFYNELLLDPDSAFAHYVLFQSALNEGDFESAKKLSQRLSEKYTDHFLTHLAQGKVLFHQNDFLNSKNIFTLAFKQEPTYLELQEDLSFCEAALGKYNVAIHTLEFLRSENKLGVKGFLKAAELFAILRNGAKEEEWLKIGTLRFPEEIDLQLQLIRKYLNENRMAEAVRRADFLYEKNPKNPKVLQLQGGLARHQEDFVKATRYFKQLVEVTPNSAESWLFLAESLKSLQQDAAADEALNKALTLHEHYLPALALRAKWEFAAKNYEKALTAVAKARALAPTDAEMALLEGDILFAERKYEEAERDYTLAYQLNPSKAGAFALFRVKQSRGDHLASQAILSGYAKMHEQDAALQAEIKALLNSAG